MLLREVEIEEADVLAPTPLGNSLNQGLLYLTSPFPLLYPLGQRISPADSSSYGGFVKASHNLEK